MVRRLQQRLLERRYQASRRHVAKYLQQRNGQQLDEPSRLADQERRRRHQKYLHARLLPYRNAALGKEIDRNWFFQKESLEKAQSKYGTDKHSVYGDPGFADPDNGDYTVTNEKLAKEIGWKNFPMDQFGVQKPALKAIAKKPQFPKIKLTADEVIAGVEYMGGVIKNIQNDNEKSVAGLPDYKGAKIVKGLTKGIFSVVKLQDDDVVLKIDNHRINNIDDFKSRMDSGKRYKKMSVWRFQKMVVLDLPDPAAIPILLDKRKWKVVSFDSESKGYEAKLAIDGDSKSFWHTQFETE